MKAPMARDKYLALALAAASLLLLGVLAWEWEQGKNLERELLSLRKLPVTAVPAQKILPEFSLPDKEAGFPELLSRPIFSLSRRASGSASKDAGSMKKGQFVLVGVLITPGQRSALLRDVVSNKTETVALVGVVRGLTLGDVQADRVTLRQGAESEELMLNVQTGPKPPAAARNPAAPLAPPAAAPPAAVPPAAPASGAVPAMPGASAPVPAASAAKPPTVAPPSPPPPPPPPPKPATAPALPAKAP